MTKQKTYVGAWPLTMARTVSGGYAQVYAGDPVTVDIATDDLKRLLDEGALTVVETDAPDTDGGSGAPSPGSIPAILAEVGDDKAKAEAALAEENAKGDKARKGLVEKLEAIITEPSA